MHCCTDFVYSDHKSVFFDSLSIFIDWPVLNFNTIVDQTSFRCRCSRFRNKLPLPIFFVHDFSLFYIIKEFFFLLHMFLFTPILLGVFLLFDDLAKTISSFLVNCPTIFDIYSLLPSIKSACFSDPLLAIMNYTNFTALLSYASVFTPNYQTTKKQGSVSLQPESVFTILMLTNRYTLLYSLAGSLIGFGIAISILALLGSVS